MKRLIISILLCLVLFSCASSKKNDFYKRKYQSENNKSYTEKRGLMLLNNTQIGRNKYMQSKNYQKTLKQSHKRLHK